ncbi:Major facilitator superfamily domain general substrate transporter [Penicillium macrosclerotiorum]|uniref:Major facilitator superfamily domain general substrate transporter n=1 Tax=Penicillium macrosclerotiorum TaxID=303699 RepID=UPI0025483374|nr:Major facilitator superfamily domain general substrate transporter [Penicillium macrosclerotiorum]KAJ5698425.1 Major facilitator superfamily domain general substrate transporter [Penicillium macrosclerotiorum]
MGVRPLIRRTRTVFRHMVARESEQADNDFIEQNAKQNVNIQRGSDTNNDCLSRHSGSESYEMPDANAQHGVQDVEAVTTTWSRRTLVAVFINIWFLYFVNAFQATVTSSLNPYVTSSFKAHSLSAVPTALGDAFAAATYLPMAKMMDVWGRAEGFLFMVICLTIGLVLMASCDSFEVYCAANIFYYSGFYGMEYAIDVVTADASTLKNRAFAYALTSSPYIITAFAGPKVANEFYYQVTWRWGFGTWAIMTPLAAIPLYTMLKYNLYKAEKEGHRIKRPSGRTVLESIWYWTVQVDLFGVFVFTAGLVLFELPFDIADYAPQGWASAYIIAMLVLGFSMLFVFAFWERWLAPVPLFDWRLLTHRTIIGAVLLDATYQLSNYCWSYYFTSWLQVNNDLTITTANYISNIFDMVSGVLLLLVGWIIRRVGRYKWTLYIAVPLYIFTQGLMIHFRQPNMNVGYQVMCQIFLAIGGSIFILIEQLSILAAVDHQHVATALALLNVAGTIGDSAGLTISTVIWQNTYIKALLRYLPESAMSNLDNIYEDLVTQCSYPIGSATRLAIQKAYAYAELRLLAVGCGIMVLAIPWTILIKDVDLKRKRQVKGTVF